MTQRLTILNSHLAPEGWAHPEPVTWTSFDGRRIEGILVTPDPSIRRPVPLIVVPHGGPSFHWSLGFLCDPLTPSQYLVAQGYAVLYPNPRGSTGYGEAFNVLNRGDLGGGDFRDIDAGVDSLVAAGVADSARLAIHGWSYGGFMASWSVSHTDRYACAVVAAGPSDFISDYRENDLSPFWDDEFLGGRPSEDPERALAHSPVFQVGRIRTPILIVHGAEDGRVPPQQSRELYAALRDAGVPVRFLVYPREGHGLDEPDHQVDFLKRQVAWYEEHFRR